MTALTDADLDRLEALAKSAQAHFDWARQPHAHFVESANPSTVLALIALARRARRMEEALRVVLDHVDYTSGACGLTEMVGGALPQGVIAKARAILSEPGA